MEHPLIVTPENLLQVLPELGPWSCYGLAEAAVKHYHPELVNPEGEIDIDDILKVSGGKTFSDWVKKYHREFGYKANELDNPACVNER